MVEKTCTNCLHGSRHQHELPCRVCPGPHSEGTMWQAQGTPVSLVAANMTSAEIIQKAMAEGYPDNNPKTVLGLKKPAMSSVPPAALVHLMRAMADGRRKYGLMNWREKRVSATIYYDAALRHLLAWYDGEQSARDSGVHHLGHAMACLAIVLDAEATGNLNDDRPVHGAFADLIDQFTQKDTA